MRRLTTLPIRGLALTVGVVVPVLAIASIWARPLLHHYVHAPAPSPSVVQSLRSSPSDALLVELGAAKHTLIPPFGRLIDDPVAAAEILLRGVEEAGAAAQARSPVPFNPHLLGDLDYASLLVPRTLLKAYQVSGEARYFDAARDFILDLAAYDLSAWLPTGSLWNDHAIAARSLTYSDFWRAYRRHPDFDEEEARTFLRLVIANAKRLADPKLYTHGSNHGTMQNVALLHLSLAFPELDGFRDLAALGIARQIEQSGYMISSEGFVLEHSAGYHRLGMELLAVALRYRTLQAKPLPMALVETYERALAVTAQLRGTDGLLPPLGDTSVSRDGSEPLTTEISTTTGEAGPLRRDRVWPRPSPASWFPDAGYAVWWSGADGTDAAAQTAIAWSRFPRHGHKHADELSFNLRAGSTFWWRSVGYWPLGDRQRGTAESWTGSNAPHLVGERAASPRASALRGFGSSQGVVAIDLERSGPGSFRARRQLVHVAPSLWLTLDHFEDEPGRHARLVWGTGPDVRITEGGTAGVMQLRSPGATAGLDALFLGAPAVTARIVRGQEQPFAGWVEEGYRAKPADAVVIVTPSSDAWLANLSIAADPDGAALDPRDATVEWRGPEDWRLGLSTGEGPLSIERDGALIRVTREQSLPVRELALSAPPLSSPWRDESEALYASAASRYGSDHRDLVDYRKRLTLLLAALLVLQELGLLVLRGWIGRWAAPLRSLAATVWLGIAGWVHFFYLTV